MPTTSTTRPWGYIPPSKPPKGRPLLAYGYPELETRSCACGCARRFKVLPASKQLYASKRCEEMSK